MFTLAEAKRRLGITDSSSDALIKLALDTTVRVASNYCNRDFALSVAWMVEYNATEKPVISLDTYPLDSISLVYSFDSDSNIENWDIDLVNGLLTLQQSVSGIIQVTVTGGYNLEWAPGADGFELPLELELAFWGIFNNVWASMNSTSGSASAGEIEALAITGVGSIKYRAAVTGLASAASGLIPPEYAAILDLYRRNLA